MTIKTFRSVLLIAAIGLATGWPAVARAEGGDPAALAAALNLDFSYAARLGH